MVTLNGKIPSKVSYTQCRLSKKQSSSGRYGTISIGVIFFLPPPNTLSMLGLLIFIVTYLYHSRPRKMGNSHYIGKRHIFVCRRDCRNAPVFCQRGKSSFFAYPMGGVNLLFIHYNLRFNTAMVADTQAWRYALWVIHHSVLLGFPYLTYRQHR